MEQGDLFTEKEDQSLLSAFGWWEKKRIAYNLFVGLTGLFFIFLSPSFNVADFLRIIFYGIIANLFYTLGFLIEIVSRYYFKSNIDFTEKRKTLFTLGLILSLIVTAALGMLYSMFYNSPSVLK